MSDPEKKIVDDTEAEKEDSNEQLSDEEEYPPSEIVVGLPALSINRNLGAGSTDEEAKDEELKEEEGNGEQSKEEEAKEDEAKDDKAKEDEARLKEQAVVAAALVIAAAEEAATKGKSDEGRSGGKQKKQNVRKMRKLTDINDEAGGSGEGETKKPRRRASELTHPPLGPPVFNVCGKGFGSWKAVFGHLRSHKERNYQGFNPPPTFSAAAENFTIPSANSAFILVTAGGRSESSGVAASVASASGGEGGRGLDIDLNEVPVDEKEEEVAEEDTAAKFDLNKSPPKDEEKNG